MIIGRSLIVAAFGYSAAAAAAAFVDFQ